MPFFVPLLVAPRFQHPYYFDFDVDVPEWAKPDSNTKKPNGWFSTWLELSGTLRQPDGLPVYQDASKKRSLKKLRSCGRKSLEALDPTEFGRQVRQARTERGESLTTMAQKLDISRTQLSQIENGRYPAAISYQVKSRILDCLGVSA